MKSHIGFAWENLFVSDIDFTFKIALCERCPIIQVSRAGSHWTKANVTATRPQLSVRKFNTVGLRYRFDHVFRVSDCDNSNSILLASAFEGWGKVMFSQVCVPQGTPPPNPGMGYPLHRPWMGYPLARSGQGVPQVPPPPARTTEGVLDTRRAVCLLRSRRRTFLLVMFLKA